jgi:hypothetical protein
MLLVLVQITNSVDVHGRKVYMYRHVHLYYGSELVGSKAVSDIALTSPARPQPQAHLKQVKVPRNVFFLLRHTPSRLLLEKLAPDALDAISLAGR